MRIRPVVDAVWYTALLVVAIPFGWLVTVPLDAWYEHAPFMMRILELAAPFATSAMLCRALGAARTRHGGTPVTMAAWRGSERHVDADDWTSHLVRCFMPYAVLGAAMFGVITARTYDMRGALMCAGVALGPIALDAYRVAASRRPGLRPPGALWDTTR